MVRKIYADTNVWYGLGTGALSKSALIGGDEELWATPVNLLEIVGGLKVGNWEGRQAAATAILKFADGMAADPETHLVARLGGTANFDSPNWDDVCRAASHASDVEQLERGVPDYLQGVRRSVAVDFLAKTKAQHYDDFALKLAIACDEYVPGYLDAYRAKTNAPKLSKQLREKFREAARAVPFVAAMLVFGIGGRYQLLTDQPLDLVDEKVIETLVEAFTSYGRMYTGYIAELVTTGRKPSPNDWGDLELFLYLQGDSKVLTGEKKWLSIAEAAGIGPLVPSVTT